MIAAAPAAGEAGQRSGRPAWRFPAGGGWDRRGGLLDGEAAAVAAIGPVGLRRNRATGIPRRTAQHWRAIARLAGPLDAARAALHHDNDVCFKRPGAQAAAIVLQHCAETGRSYWGWTQWE